MGCQGGSRSVFTHAFQAKRELRCIFLKKKVIIITSKHGTTIFFSHKNLFLGKLKEKLAWKARVHTDASISDRAHAPWASHNTPQIQLIQYGCRIGKKVYWKALSTFRTTGASWITHRLHKWQTKRAHNKPFQNNFKLENFLISSSSQHRYNISIQPPPFCSIDYVVMTHITLSCLCSPDFITI